MTINISCTFDSGNISILDERRSDDIQLEIRKDAGGEHLQWFHFRVSGAINVPLRMRLMNAAACSYPRGWSGYQVCASSDRQTWFRVPTRYENGELIIEHCPPTDQTYYAYFPPYSTERHQDLIARASMAGRVRAHRLGATLDGRDLDLLVVGQEDTERKPCWVIARQHPGETMAEWLVEGLIERLLDKDDPVARSLLTQATFYIVPNMNPDGSARGHLRCNQSGANLNREWLAPTMERSPEVYLVREEMKKRKVQFALDVHGDESLPYNFIAGSDGVDSLPKAIIEARHIYEERLMLACPDFQTKEGYPTAAPGNANLKMATNWIAAEFGALAMTLEQPFKDTIETPHPEGWSPARAKNLGRANLDALLCVIEQL